METQSASPSPSETRQHIPQLATRPKTGNADGSQHADYNVVFNKVYRTHPDDAKFITDVILSAAGNQLQPALHNEGMFQLFINEALKLQPAKRRSVAFTPQSPPPPGKLVKHNSQFPMQGGLPSVPLAAMQPVGPYNHLTSQLQTMVQPPTFVTQAQRQPQPQAPPWQSQPPAPRGGKRRNRGRQANQAQQQQQQTPQYRWQPHQHRGGAGRGRGRGMGQVTKKYYKLKHAKASHVRPFVKPVIQPAAKLQVFNREAVVNGVVTSLFFTRVEAKTPGGATRYSIKIDSIELANNLGTERYYIESSIPLNVQFPGNYERATILHQGVQAHSAEVPVYSKMYHSLMKDLRPGDLVSLAEPRAAGDPDKAKAQGYSLKKLYHVMRINREASINVDNKYRSVDVGEKITVLGNGKCAERMPVYIGPDWHVGHFAILKSNSHLMWNPGTRLQMEIGSLSLAETSGGAQTSESGQSSTNIDNEAQLLDEDYEEATYHTPTLDPNQLRNAAIAADSSAAIGQT